MGSHPIVHFELGARDIEAQSAYYSSLFGWSLSAFDPAYRMVEPPGGEGIGGGIMALAEGMPSYVTVYVQTDDIEATLASAVALGGTEVVPPTPIPVVGRFALFSDPEGQMIGLLEPAPEG